MKEKKQLKLYDLPRGSKLVIDGLNVIFDHIDGMYSYCTWVPDGTEKTPLHPFHLAASAPMKKVGDHYEIDSTSLSSK